MVVSDTLEHDRWFTIALVMLEFWAKSGQTQKCKIVMRAEYKIGTKSSCVMHAEYEIGMKS